MREAEGEARRYHHGDLRRGLIDAARQILEADGPSALSLRAVARQAGVSPAAPYHHFKDKAELLGAVAQEGWRALQLRMIQAKAGVSADERLAALGVAYVGFARENPALYRVMYEAARQSQATGSALGDGQGATYSVLRDTMVECGGEPDGPDLELAALAAWSSAHGLAEMAGFKRFHALKAQLGGETAFFKAVLSHMAVFPTPRR